MTWLIRSLTLRITQKRSERVAAPRRVPRPLARRADGSRCTPLPEPTIAPREKDGGKICLEDCSLKLHHMFREPFLYRNSSVLATAATGGSYERRRLIKGCWFHFAGPQHAKRDPTKPPRPKVPQQTPPSYAIVFTERHHAEDPLDVQARVVSHLPAAFCYAAAVAPLCAAARLFPLAQDAAAPIAGADRAPVRALLFFLARPCGRVLVHVWEAVGFDPARSRDGLPLALDARAVGGRFVHPRGTVDARVGCVLLQVVQPTDANDVRSVVNFRLVFQRYTNALRLRWSAHNKDDTPMPDTAVNDALRALEQVTT